MNLKFWNKKQENPDRKHPTLSGRAFLKYDGTEIDGPSDDKREKVTLHSQGTKNRFMIQGAF